MLASTCIWVVSNGAGLYSSFVSTSYVTTVPNFASSTTDMIASASSLSQNGLPECSPLNASMPNLPTISQYGFGTKLSISSCLSTSSLRVGLWTLPTDMKFLPTCPDERDMSLVRTAPQDRSMICLASAASASLSLGSVRSAKAASTSPFVRALNLALLTLERSVPISLTVSIPMSSPSRS